MKRIFFAAVFVLAAFSFANGQAKNPAVEKLLIQMDKDWTAAELRGDKDAVSKYIADDYIGTLTDGTVQNKTQYMAAVAASTDKDVADDYNVRVFGNVAIMTHRGTVTGTDNLQYRSTHVWMKRGGKWLLVAHHGGDIPKPAAK
jgi:ketosteroid isomerase-like protein